MKHLFFISSRYWLRRPGRSLTMLFGVAFGVALLVSVGLINQSIIHSYDNVVRELAGRAQIEVRAINTGGFTSKTLRGVSSIDGVHAAVPIIEKRSYLFYEGRKVPLLLRGVDPLTDRSVHTIDISAGRALEQSDHQELLLSSSLQQSLGVSIGSNVELLTPTGFITYRVVGAFTGLELLNAPQSRVGMVPISELQASYFARRRVIEQIDVRLEPDASVATVSAALEAFLEGSAQVQQPLERAAQVASLSQGVRFMLLLAGFISLVAAAYLIANNAFASLEERRRELATLRALGLGTRQLNTWLRLEATCIGACGSLLGTVLGVGAAYVLITQVSDQLFSLYPLDIAASTLVLAPLVLAGGFMLGMLITVLATVPAIRRFHGLPLTETLRQRGPKQRNAPVCPPMHQRLFMIITIFLSIIITIVLHTDGILVMPGSVWQLLALGVIMCAMVSVALYLPFVVASVGQRLRQWRHAPIWLQLAGESLRQYSARAGAVAASLMITLSILIGVFGMVNAYRTSVRIWVNEMFGWDLMVSTSMQGFKADVPLSDAVGGALKEIPGVAVVSPERFAIAALGTQAVNLYVYDMNSFLQMRQLTTIDGVNDEDLPAALAGQAKIAISSSLAPLYNLKVGDSLTLSIPAGERRYEIAAIVDDPGAIARAVYIDRSVYVQDWQETLVDSYALLLKPGADPQVVMTEIDRTLGERFPLQVSSASTLKAHMNQRITETFGLSQGLVLMAVLMALFGLGNASMIAAWQLRYQLATLRAIGASVALITKALLAEVWITSVIGGGVGLVMGTLLSSVLLKSMQSSSLLVIDWTWPLHAYLLVAIIAGIGSLIAGFLPSSAAGRAGLSKALRYD